VGSDLADATFLSDSFGLVLDKWQRLVLGGWLGVRSDGRWAASPCGLAVPRQNGKNAVIEARELFGMIIKGEKILHTAHEVKTARKAFLRLLGFFDNPGRFPELAALCREVRRTNGQEAIALTNGGSVEFIARSKGSGRGFSVDVLVMDEAQELSEEALAALMPTVSASDNPQLIYAGTPPSRAANGEVFTRVRAAGVSGSDPRECWHEWSAEARDDGAIDFDCVDVWAQANPAMGIRLREETMRGERTAMDDETFGRERLGLWSVLGGSGLVDPGWWDGLVDGGSQVLDPVAFAVDVSPLGRSASISLAGRRADGRLHVEVVRSARGTEWVVDAVGTLEARFAPCAVIVDRAGPAGGILLRLAEAGIEVLETGAAQMTQACGGLLDAVHAGDVVHLDQLGLTAALHGARTRPVGDAFAFARRHVDGVDITPLVSVALALWGFRHVEATVAPVEPVEAVFF
jgi:phage terminase large subunit-like protein